MRLTALAEQRPTRKMPPPGQIIATSDSIPASVGGWDTLSPIAEMPQDHAVLLDNWIPRPGFLEVRRGTQSYATGMGASTSIQSLMAYNAGNTNNSRLFAAAGTRVWNVTGGGAAVSSLTPITNTKFQHTNFSDAASNHYLLICNGVDAEQKYDGTSWTAFAPSSGLAAGSAIQIMPHKNRLWIVRNNTTAPLYMPVGTISGAATAFELGGFMSKGGYIVAIATWSVDTRQTVDDYWAAITSRGQVIVYQGTDPSSASTWGLVGVYDLGAPIGQRCFLRVAGDLFIITVDGILPMTQMLSTDRAAANRVSLTAQIMDTMRTSAQLYGSNFGWQFASYPRGMLAILNVPTTTNSVAQQYVMNTITGAWGRFLGINANCWENYNDKLYVGRNDGTVYKFDTDSADGTTPITATVATAFNYFGSRGRRKIFSAVRPIITTDHAISPGVGINVDFNTGGAVTTPSFGTFQGAQWDVAQWDVDTWPTNSAINQSWASVAGEGYCASIIMQATTTQSGLDGGITLQLNGFDIAMQPGGIL